MSGKDLIIKCHNENMIPLENVEKMRKHMSPQQKYKMALKNAKRNRRNGCTPEKAIVTVSHFKHIISLLNKKGINQYMNSLVLSNKFNNNVYAKA